MAKNYIPREQAQAAEGKDLVAPRRSLTRGHGYETEDEVLQAARGWLLSGWAVRIVRTKDQMFTLEAWEA